MCARIMKEPRILGKTFSQLEEDDPHRSDINVLHVACQEGLADTICFILDERPDLIHTKSQAGWTPLMNACEAGQLEAITIMLDHDMEQLSYKCQNGMPLHAAITGKEPTMTVSYILTRDTSQVNAEDLSGVTPLYLAVFTGNYECV